MTENVSPGFEFGPVGGRRLAGAEQSERVGVIGWGQVMEGFGSEEEEVLESDSERWSQWSFTGWG